MKRFLVTIAWLLTGLLAKPHPGTGIVKDSKGIIYYTDLQQVWKLSPCGGRSIAVANVHTHELFMDDSDNLYGEHLWYNGERLNTFGSYAWCLRSNGKLDTVMAPKEGFLENYGFARDSQGNQYWAERFTVTRIKKKTRNGVITTLVEGRFIDVRWMHATAGGLVYFVDLLNLYRIDTSGTLTLLATGLAAKPGQDNASARHCIFGIWTDDSNNVYAAVMSERTVKKISPDGRVTDFCYSSIPWAPVGGVFDEDGDLWLMECNIANETRVREIKGAERLKGSTQTIAKKTILLPVGGSVLFLALCVWGIRRLTRRNEQCSK